MNKIEAAKAVVEAARAKPVEDGESFDSYCVRCGDTYELRSGCIQTPECDPCAHDVLSKIREAVAAYDAAEDVSVEEADEVERWKRIASQSDDIADMYRASAYDLAFVALNLPECDGDCAPDGEGSDPCITEKCLKCYAMAHADLSVLEDGRPLSRAARAALRALGLGAK